MEKMWRNCFFLCLFGCILIKLNYAIYAPGENVSKKPVTTFGIKSLKWQNQNGEEPIDLQIHHNYSKVNVQRPNHVERQMGEYPLQTTNYSDPYISHHKVNKKPDDFSNIELFEPTPKTRNQFTPKQKSNARPSQPVSYFEKKPRHVEAFSKCPKMATGQFVFELSCNQFLSCWKGRGYVQNCAPGTLFNPKTLECDYAEKVECVSGPERGFDNQPNSFSGKIQAKCPKRFSGLIPHYEDCTKFFSCADGVENLMICPPGTNFDVKTNNCDFPEKATCVGDKRGRQLQPGIEDENGNGALEYLGQEEVGKKHVDYGNQRETVFCGNLIGVFSHPTDCSKYFNCTELGEEYVGQCVGRLFNHVLKKCDFAYNVNCEALDRRLVNQKRITHNSNNNRHLINDKGKFQNQSNGNKGYNIQNYNSQNRGFNNNQNFDNLHHGYDNPNLNNQGFESPTLNSKGFQGYLNQGHGGQNHGNRDSPFGDHAKPGLPYRGYANSGLPNRGLANEGSLAKHNFVESVFCGNLIGIFAHPKDCAKFFNCTTSGQGFVMQCVDDKLFNHLLGQCDVPQNVNCQSSDRIFLNQPNQGNKRSYDTQSVAPNQLVETVNCDNLIGVFPHPNDCAKFFNCTGFGQGFVFQCVNKVFNHVSKTCDLPQNVNCQAVERNLNVIGNGNGYIQTENANEGFQQNGRPECPHNAAGLYPHPSDCSKFLNCANGMTFIQDCAPGTLFNSMSKICDFPYNVICDKLENEQTETKIPGRKQISPIFIKPNLHLGSAIQDTSIQNGHNQNINQNSYLQEPLNAQNPGNTNTHHFWYPQNVDQNVNSKKPARNLFPTENQYLQNNDQNLYNTQNQYLQTSNQNLYPKNPTQILLPTQIPQSSNQYFNPTKPTQNLLPTQGQYPQNPNQNLYPENPTVQNQYPLMPNQNRYPKNQIPNHFPQNTNQNQYVQTVYPQYPDQNVYNPSPIQNQGKTLYNTQTADQNLYQRIPGRNTYDQNLADPQSQKNHQQKSKQWPPPFPSTDVNADYVFDYDDAVALSTTNDAKNEVVEKRKFCEGDDFHCAFNECVLQNSVCDGTKDCADGSDEVNCSRYLESFRLVQNTKLAIREQVKLRNLSATSCAKQCLETKDFQCKSFNYRRHDGLCLLTSSNIPMSGALIIYRPFDYYEHKLFSSNCTDMFKCPNGKCVKKDKSCDGIDDCGDRTDEKNCSASDLGYAIRLAGSHFDNEGRIEVTVFGKTGYVCDDNFGLRDADVICHELGFPLGAIEVKGHSHFAADVKDNDTLFLMDDVTCSGNETSLRDCDFNGWGVHNCLPQEIVGVVCKTPLEQCPEDFWKCDTGQECLPLAFICDGVSDCTDGSDEGDQHCEAPIEMRLANGSNQAEGRVEIRYHGTWGTICDDDFNEDAAKVVCKYFGYRGTAVVKKDSFFGPGQGPIWLDQVYCQGNETLVQDCDHWNWGEHNCEHNEDVGVICSSYDNSGSERNAKVGVVAPAVPVVTLSSHFTLKSCGLRRDDLFEQNDDVHFRVVKGSIAKRGEYPWQASIRVKGKTKPAHWCGAVVISNKFVLTAAHCLVGFSKGAYLVVAGDYNVDDDEGTEQQAYIDDFYIHEKFRNEQRMNNDIALIKLKGNGFVLSRDIQPICLPETETTYENDLNCTISGFGSIQSGKSAYSHDLRAGWIPIQRSEVCKMPHVYGSSITEGMFCAGSLDEGVDACDGDSGGPLACLKDGLFTLFGLTSWGQHCGYANKPGVYVKISHYRKWIDETMKKHS